jgi:cellulose synthase/poly-beta-1,6-N-acetylglucosamine synthase-like glycosyltransferase
MYVQIFFFVTFLENRKKILIRNKEIKLSHYPKVTITVPCWNEEKTVYKTVRSLLNIHYPKDKIQIFLIDDGSTDNTFKVISKFSKYSNIKVFHKENGGKYTVLNFGLEHSDAEFFGCLDADSEADPEALVRIMSYFEKDGKIMAVAPSVIVHNYKNFIQSAQTAEYYMGVYFKKMFGFLGAIDVTPGPLTIFRKKVFDNLGGYRHAHGTEDMEIAYRMQKNNYKIEHCNDAFVYTNTPNTIRKLYRQRVRWIFGFINNTIDYKNSFFEKKQGNFSFFALPSRVISVVAIAFLSVRFLYSFGKFLYSKIVVYKIVGLDIHLKHFVFDPFFVNTQAIFFLFLMAYFFVFFSMLFGRRMAEGKWAFSKGMIFYFPVFSFIAPFWLFKAAFNTILKRKPSWR